MTREDKGLSEFKFFTGFIISGETTIAISFDAKINNYAELEFKFYGIDFNKERTMLLNRGESREIEYLILEAQAEDGTKIKTDSFNITSSRLGNAEGDLVIEIEGGCNKAIFTKSLKSTSLKPLLQFRMRGFRSLSQFTYTSVLGAVVIGGNNETESSDVLSGVVKVSSEIEILAADATKWKDNALSFLEHVNRVMSFAQGLSPRTPIIEFYFGDTVEVTYLRQGRNNATRISHIHFLDNENIFKAAVNSYFNPIVQVKNLRMALEWFSIDSSYSEVRLINAMTVLENLIASNLSDEDQQIRKSKAFDKIKKEIRASLKNIIEEETADEELIKKSLKEINEKLPDLNRKTLLNKLKILLQRWEVPMMGIDDVHISEAKRARDLIVHNGFYDKEKSNELWLYVTIVREIVVRVFLTVLSYEGCYISYVNGYRTVSFPPKEEDWR
ncbi:MAG: hypothetical protein ACO1N8_03960 [Methylophilus sp.]